MSISLPTFEECVNNIQESIRPEVIALYGTSTTDENRVVLLRPKGIKELAFCIYPNRRLGTRIQLMLLGMRNELEQFIECSFYCCCCGLFGEGRKPDNSFPKLGEKDAKICEDAGIRYLGVRKGGQNLSDNVYLFEADDFLTYASRHYDKDFIQQQMKFMHCWGAFRR